MFPERGAALACLSNEWTHWQGVGEDKGWGRGENLRLIIIEEMSKVPLPRSPRV